MGLIQLLSIDIT